MTTRIGMVVHHHRTEVKDLVARALDWCEVCDLEPVMPPEDAALVGRPEVAVSEEAFAEGLDLCISFGGDGTMLRAVHLVTAAGVPVLGVNAGDLGYMAEIDPPDLESALNAWRNGELEVQERMMLEVRRYGDAGIGERVGLALNEAVVERLESGHVVSLEAAIGGNRFTTYKADGLIVATPTGSTAYSLSAGGPIIEPDFQAIIVNPVAAHMVFDRAMVLAPSTEVLLTIEGHRSAVVTLDGRPTVTLDPGDQVICTTAPEAARFLVRGDRDFHAVLKEKFGLTDR